MSAASPQPGAAENGTPFGIDPRGPRFGAAITATLLLVVVLLLAARSLRAALFWAGIPCLIAGSLCALLALPSASLTHWALSTFVLPQLPPQVPAITTDLMLSLATTTFDEVLGTAFNVGAVLGLCGLIATLVACLLKSKPNPL